MEFPKMKFTKPWIAFLAVHFTINGMWYTTEKFLSGEYIYMTIGGVFGLLMALVMFNTLSDAEW